MGEAAEVAKGALFKIGILAELSGKTIRTLHFYEEQGLLTPARRTEGGFRLYNSESLARVKLVDKLQVLGMTLTEARDLLQSFENSETGHQAARNFMSTVLEKRRALDAEIKRLSALHSELTETVEYLAHCVHLCEKASSPSACASCGHATNDERRPEIMTGIYS